MGTKEELSLFILTLDQELITEISEFYPNRGNSKQGRIYIEAKIDVTTMKFTKERLPTQPKIMHPWWNYGSK